MLVPVWATAQVSLPEYIYDSYSEVSQSGKVLAYPFAGGMNNPQIWSVQLNDDDFPDMLIFDRDGDKLLTFLNNGTGGSAAFEHAPEYQGFFPGFRHFIVTADYNCDGLEDLFVSHEDGIRVYKALMVDGHVEFEVAKEQLQYREAGFTFDMSVGIIDIPAIVDVNMDGDMDVLTFKLVGGFVDYFENQAVENGEDCETLDLLHVNSCWGDFYESGVFKSVELDSSCDGRYAGGADVQHNAMHAGSTFMVYDDDADGVNDLVLGDLNFTNLNFLKNGGAADMAYIVEQDTIFPGYNVPVDVITFPAPFLFDADNDGHKDMLVAPNKDGFSLNTSVIWYYQNISPDDTYQFSYQHDTLFSSDMIDVGTGARPVFFDHNDDGLTDMVIGNFGYFEDGTFTGRLALYENTGTEEIPAWSLVTRNYANMEIYGFRGLAPTFGDLDNDGDLDMIIGEEDGFIHFFVNTAGPGTAATFALLGPNYQGIDVGKFSSPLLVDLDQDGLLDLVIGEQNGNVNYYRNEGTAESALFTLVSESWGGIDVRLPGLLTGHSMPWVMERDGNWDVYVGSESGQVFVYTTADPDELLFEQLTDKLSDLDEGSYCAVSLIDVTGDGVPELLTGNERGGVTLYRDKETLDAICPDLNVQTLNVFPVPANDKLMIGQPVPGVLTYLLSDLQGRPVGETMASGDAVITMDVNEYSTGLYILSCYDKEGRLIAVAKVIIE